MSQSAPVSSPKEPDFPHRYTATLADQIELRWHAWWEQQQTFHQPNPGEPGFDASKPKFYCLDMFPYPSGAGLHVGHPEGYTATDIICRYKKLKGYNVLHPMGWDAFGLPAEQYAIQTGVHPAITTKKAIDNFRRQLQRFGFCYDWSREFGTIDENYYKWTQWIFLQVYNSWFDEEAKSPSGLSTGRARPISDLIAQLESGAMRVGPSGEIVREGLSGFAAPLEGGMNLGRAWHELTQQERRLFIDNQRLAYLGEQTVNWCPKLGTVLANDEVIDGRSERGGYPVLRKPLKQWMFRITAYADRLLEQLGRLDWPSSTRIQQAEWIGKSTGAQVDFDVDAHSLSPQALGELKSAKADMPLTLTVYTTRPDTIFGATFMVIAPEHPLIDHVLRHPSKDTDAAALGAYVQRARNMSDVDRMEGKEKTGVFSGVYAINPLTDEKIPIWVADYVLMGYGTGAIMAVPAHDERDFEFAKKFNLPIVDVLYPRTALAMKYFCDHATEAESADGIWQQTLADFLGIVTGETADLAKALEIVRSRRAATGAAAADGHVDATSLDAIGMKSRGAIRITWLEAFESMGIGSLSQLKQTFDRRGFQSWRGEAGVSNGIAVHSSRAAKDDLPAVSLDGLTSEEAVRTIIAWMEEAGVGTAQTRFKLRDWTFSRQRYWGEPFPIVFDEAGNHYPVSEKSLPVILPPLNDYQPEESEDPQPLLAKARQWANTTAFAAGVDPNLLAPETPVHRETNTMPGSAGSSWYCVRYCDPKNPDRLVGEEAERYWMGGIDKRIAGDTNGEAGNDQLGGVDLYIGGNEHAVGHLLYSRFWHNVLFDLGHLSTPEPFQKLFHQGLITSYAYQRADKTILPVDEVKEISEGKFVEIANSQPVTPIVTKMSKRYKNVTNPDDVIAEYGADTFRLYEMYMGPLEASKPWNTKDIPGLFRFLQRTWRVLIDEQTGQPRLASTENPALEKLLHRTIHKAGHDFERLSFNTAIASMIQLVNEAMSAGGEKGTGAFTRSQAERFCIMLSPLAPHIAEEIWSRLGMTETSGCVSTQVWPVVDEQMLVDDSVEMPVQVQGKVRARITVPTGAEAKAVEAMALADEGVQKAIGGKPVKKIIIVPGKLVNVVV
ncbi:MAG: leucine--tRNA ligase [Phycisphaeraceae bacterium]|nr:leucine--tRNA ligase [Phycisphaeraceae bacterium]